MSITADLDFLVNKVNVRAVGTRINEATAEDFHEIAELFQKIIGVINNLTGDETQNPTYGVHTSLDLLQAAYPTATPLSYAIIDPGTGVNSQIALWDDSDSQWVLQVVSSTTTTAKIVSGVQVTNVEVTDVNGDPYLILSGEFTGTDASSLESYGPNSVTRAL